MIDICKQPNCKRSAPRRNKPELRSAPQSRSRRPLPRLRLPRAPPTIHATPVSARGEITTAIAIASGIGSTGRGTATARRTGTRAAKARRVGGIEEVRRGEIGAGVHGGDEILAFESRRVSCHIKLFAPMYRNKLSGKSRFICGTDGAKKARNAKLRYRSIYASFACRG